MIPLFKVKMFFLSISVCRVKFKVFKKNELQTQLAIQHMQTPFWKEERKMIVEMYPSCFLLLPPQRTSGFLRCLHVSFSELYSNNNSRSSPSHGVGCSIVLFRRNVELASCGWMLLTFRRSPATFKCTFGTRRPKRNFIISLNGLQWTPSEFICGRPKKTFFWS